MRYWGFVSILIQNSNLSPAPPPPFVPPLHAYSCKVQTRSVWSGKVMWGNAFLPFADTGDFLLETCSHFAGTLPWAVVRCCLRRGNWPYTNCVNLLSNCTAALQKISFLCSVSAYSPGLIASLMVINRLNSPISALKTFLQILWEFGLKTTSAVNIVIFHRRHKETRLHSP